MTISAINKKTGDRVILNGIEDPKKQLGGVTWHDLVCPITDLPVVPVKKCSRSGHFVKSHFRRKEVFVWPDHTIPDEEYFTRRGGPERIEHIEGKLKIITDAIKYDEECKPNLAVPEYRVMINREGKYRIIDVAFLIEDGRVLAHEMQLASISPETLAERTKDYFEAGIDVQWWFGLEAKTKANFEMHIELVGRPAHFVAFTDPDKDLTHN